MIVVSLYTGTVSSVHLVSVLRCGLTVPTFLSYHIIFFIRKRVDSYEFGTQLLAPVSSQTRVTESRGRANEFPSYEAKRNNEVRNTALSSLQGMPSCALY